VRHSLTIRQLLAIGRLHHFEIAPVSGFLSNAYEHRQIGTKAITHTVETSARAEASLLERHLTQADEAVAQVRQALVRARDDKGRVKAAQAILTSSTADRDRLVRHALGAPKRAWREQAL
jgi:hypothetical protein